MKRSTSHRSSTEKAHDAYDPNKEAHDSLMSNGKMLSIDEDAPPSNDSSSSELKPLSVKVRQTTTTATTTVATTPHVESKKQSNSEKINVEGHILFDDPSVFSKFSAYYKNLKLKLNSLARHGANVDCLRETYSIEIEPINRDFSIKNKYIYPSMLSTASSDKLVADLLGNYIESHSLIKLDSAKSAADSLKTSKNEFDRDTLLIFCLNMGDGEATKFKFNNYLVKIKLVFTELDVLKDDIKKSLDEFLNSYLVKRFKQEQPTTENSEYESEYAFDTHIDKVCYLKKPSNCKTIRLEQIKSSTDCFRAMVEFSRRNEFNEKPFIFVTCHAKVFLSKI